MTNTSYIENEKNLNDNLKTSINQKVTNSFTFLPVESEKTDSSFEKGTYRMQFLAAIIVCLCGASSGTVTSWSSPVLPELESEDSPLPITADQGTWIASTLPFGGLFGSITIGVVTNKLSRKLTIIFLTFPLLLSWALIVFVKHVNVLYLARFITGFASAGLCTVGPMYITEIAATEIRGTLGACFQVFINFGSLLTNVLGAFFNYVELSAMLALVPLLLLIGMQFLPDSPVYLMMKGNRKQAEKAIQWFRGKNVNTQPILSDMQKQIDEQSARKVSFRHIFSTAGRRKALFGAIGLIVCREFCGMGSVTAYTVQIFEAAGSSMDSHFEAIAVAFASFLLSGFLFSIIGKIKRKLLLFLGGTILVICLGSLGTYFLRKENNHDVVNINWLPMTSLILYTLGFQLGYGPIPRIFVTETFIPELRGYATGVMVMFGWGLGFLLSKNFDLMIRTFHTSGTFFIYMAICICGVVFTSFYIPETKGKSLQEIQNKLNRREQNSKSEIICYV